MATLLDALGVLQKFGFYETVFPFILVMALIYGVLSKFNPFGPNKIVNGTVAAIVAMFFISVTKMSKFLANLVPLLTAFLIIMIFIVLIFLFMGVDEKLIGKAIIENSEGYGSILIILVLLVLVVMTQIFPEQSVLTQIPGVGRQLNISLYSENASNVDKAAALLSAQTGAIIFSPKILALIIMMIVFAISAYFIVREPHK